uniref:VASt domain-containing protein n=1 Tax=Craspedostauros australis TaxID=1486917 RepID=A0A7R9ZLT7_9STRA|eukprot:CAMPEP_0198117932 /NCGR_PEP_ID=MMETSP1442-20131203/19756_1 /TAXON_ID= /ORGANISM="Craspedostauros australis, Strain CCMP3328" /LENGTH=300 /DNA_ID=CAMNT_0043776089 /DNA_START=79 /DNA_END=981 /DNA_ORIENTATION=+
MTMARKREAAVGRRPVLPAMTTAMKVVVMMMMMMPLVMASTRICFDDVRNTNLACSSAMIADSAVENSLHECDNQQEQQQLHCTDFIEVASHHPHDDSQDRTPLEAIGSLQHVGLDRTLDVSYDVLAKAMLSSRSDFWKKAVFQQSCRYQNTTVGDWETCQDFGDDSSDSHQPCATRETSYEMPKSRFAGTYMAYQTQQLLRYDEDHFVLRFRTNTPDAPFGSKFVTWTQMEVKRQEGTSSSRLICSVQPEYPNGRPMSFLANQIRNGMRSGTAEFFETFAECIQSKLGVASMATASDAQ